MAFKMKGNINFGEGTGRSAFPSVWGKLKEKAKKIKQKVKDVSMAASAHTGTNPASKTSKNNPRYKNWLKSNREAYDKGETMSEPLLAKKFEKEDRGKAVDKYIASVTKGDTKKSGENLKKVASVVKKQKDRKSKKA